MSPTLSFAALPACTWRSTVHALLVWIALAAGLAGCAYEPVPPPPPDKKVAVTFTQLGAAYYARGQFSIALENLEKAHRIDPDYGWAYAVEAVVHMDMNNAPRADLLFRKALQIDGQNANILFNYGWFLCNRYNQLQQGIGYFRQVAEHPIPTVALDLVQRARLGIVTCAMRARDFATAENFLLLAWKQNPSDRQVLLLRAQFSYSRGQFNDAKRWIGQYNERYQQPTSAALWLNLRIERRLGNQAAVLQLDKRLRQQFPKSAEARLLSEGRYDEGTSASPSASRTAR